METLLDAATRLRRSGYAIDFIATREGLLRCGACGRTHDPAQMIVEETVRYEGVSDPADESILLALLCTCGRRGLYFAAFGPAASAADGAVLGRLP
jgi:hypothetical protein